MAAGEGATAVIGKSVQIRGEVRGSEDLMIEGFVEGTVVLQESRLTVIGNVTATGRVELRSGANLTGDIQASRLSIEENAGFAGKVDLIQNVAPTPGTQTPAAVS